MLGRRTDVRLVVGPLLRYASGGQATVWVETDGPCTVSVLGHEAETFRVGEHHYALVIVEGLAEGSTTAYDVHLDGHRAWPLDGAPPSLIRMTAPGDPLRLAFGSCRVCLPHHPPYTLSADSDPRGREHDALYALARRMARGDPDEWPHKLLMLGDQIYVDEGALQTRARIRAHRDTTRPPGDGPVDFAEYAWLYHEAWGDPAIRWLLSTVGTAMVWDDHDMHDDWNISSEWVREMRDEEWWHRRVRGGVASYWVYQHLGNLSPDELERDELWQAVRASDDALAVLHEHAGRTEHSNEGTRWSWCRDWPGVRVVCVDSRAGRVLHETRHGMTHEHGRGMVDDEEWGWISEHVTGGVEHLVIASSLPVFLLPGLHWLEAADEAVADGAWGSRAARGAERLRRALDLEHWPAFQDTFHRLVALLRDVATGGRGEPPTTITIVSGDVHHAYLAAVEAGGTSRVHQAVCSPFRNSLDRHERAMLRFVAAPPGRLLGRALAAAARVERPGVRWRIEAGPAFDNQVATLTFDGREAFLRFEKTLPGDPDPDLEVTDERPL